MRTFHHTDSSPIPTIGVVFYWVLLSILLLNLNGIANMALGVGQAFSVLILSCCFVIIGTFKANYENVLGRVGYFFMGFLSFYLVYSNLLCLYWGQNPIGPSSIVQNQVYLATFLVVYSVALGTYKFILLGKGEKLLRGFAFLAILSSSTILLSFFWGGFHDIAYRYASRGTLNVISSGRFVGFFGNPNEAGNVCNVAFAISIALYFLDVYKHKIFWIAGMLVSFSASILTFSRAAILLNFAIVVLQLFFVAEKISFRKRIFMIGSIGSLALVIFLFYLNVKEILPSLNLLPSQEIRVLSMLNIVETGNANAGEGDFGDNRTFLLQEAFDIFVSTAMLGKGFGWLQNMPNSGLGPHNTFMLILGEGGIFSGVLLLGFIFTYLYDVMKSTSSIVKIICFSFFTVWVLIMSFAHNGLEYRFVNCLVGLSIGLISGTRSLNRQKFQNQ